MNDPEINLWLAVIQRTMFDLYPKIPHNKMTDKQITRQNEAKKWLRDTTSIHIGSLRWVCNAVGVHIDLVQKTANKIIRAPREEYTASFGKG